jgi:hypothetical protein
MATIALTGLVVLIGCGSSSTTIHQPGTRPAIPNSAPSKSTSASARIRITVEFSGEVEVVDGTHVLLTCEAENECTVEVPHGDVVSLITRHAARHSSVVERLLIKNESERVALLTTPLEPGHIQLTPGSTYSAEVPEEGVIRLSV